MARHAVELDDLHAPPALAYELGQTAERRAGHMIFARARCPSVPSALTCPVSNPVWPWSWIPQAHERR